jgi:Fe-S-cluster containining protein
VAKGKPTKPTNERRAEKAREQSAGAFAGWLRDARRVRRLEVAGADVPCGSCTACCTASLFVHVAPDETATLSRIPSKLLFPAPGLPGHMLMGHDERGHCPMLVEGRCSIYEDRPRTCRDFDCRVFAATGISPNVTGAQRGVVERARAWRFETPTSDDRKKRAAVHEAGAFLQKHAGAFPAGALPDSRTQRALLALEIYPVFLDRRPSRDEVVEAVTTEMARCTEPVKTADAPARPARKR